MQKRVILIITGSRRQKTLTYTEGSFRSSHQRGSVKKVFLEISQNSQENTCARVSFLIKLQNKPATLFLKKETLAQEFSYEFCEISKNTFFTERLCTTASDHFCHHVGTSWSNCNCIANLERFFRGHCSEYFLQYFVSYELEGKIGTLVSLICPKFEILIVCFILIDFPVK